MLAAPLPSQVALNRGRYTVQRLIGRGGFGRVYVAADAAGCRYAIKECLDDHYVGRAADGVSVAPRTDVPHAARIHTHQCKRAREEAAMFRRPDMQHRNLVPLIDCFDQHGTTYLVMPFVDGQPLHLAASDPQSRDTPWALDVLDQIANVLEMLHSKGLIHRDLKPDNVLITRDSAGRPHPIVLDTGATRGYRAKDEVHTGIATDFGPPEIVSSTDARLYGNPGPASDCFALAGMAHLLLTGSKPLGWGSRVAAMNTTGGSDPLVRPAALSPGVWAVLARSLSLPSLHRHSSARQLMAELTLALNQPQSPAAAAIAPAPVPTAAPASASAAAPAAPAQRATPAAQTAGPSISLGPEWLGWVGGLAAQAAGVLLCFVVLTGWVAGLGSLLLLLANWSLAIGLVRLGVGLGWATFPGVNGWVLWQTLRSRG